MPRTRVDTDREAKVAEILAVAERQLRAGGYAALSLAAIARELGIAQNTIYWYFASKDDLLVAALRRMLETTIKAKPRKEEVGLIETIVWVADQLEPFYRLKAAVSEQALRSATVADFIEEVNELLRAMLGNVLRSHVPQEDLDLSVETFAATVEGAFARGLDEKGRKKLFSFALERLIRS